MDVHSRPFQGRNSPKTIGPEGALVSSREIIGSSSMPMTDVDVAMAFVLNQEIRIPNHEVAFCRDAKRAFPARKLFKNTPGQTE